MERLGVKLKATHMDSKRAEEILGKKQGYPEAEWLVPIARVGVLLSSVRPGGYLEKELEYGNHSSAAWSGR